MKPFQISFLSISLLISSSLFSQTKITVAKGQKFNVEVSSKTSSLADMMGQQMESISNNDNTTQYLVNEVFADSIQLQSTITKLKSYSSFMGQEMNFDSEKKDNKGEMADMLGPTVNKAKNLLIGANGKIIKQDAVEDVASGLGALANAGNTDAIDLFSPALIGKQFVAGDSISFKSESKSAKGQTVDSGIYHITAIENGLANISYTGSRIISNAFEMMGIEMQVNGNNAVKTELQMDINTGLVLVKATVIDLNLSVDAMGNLIPVTGKVITTVKVTQQP
ncbi:MAG TPA: hypothetical protein PK275_06935 [Chitinophagaceae bacterium]|jgi:hypothetical protein|nr:hypothetical protein [Chitinophagaceae bacterium]